MFNINVLPVAAGPVLAIGGIPMISLATICMVIGFVVILVTWLTRKDTRLEATTRQYHQSLLGETEDEEDFPSLEGSMNAGKTTRIMRLAIAHARTELGLLSPTTANRKVVSDVIRKFMKNHNMRPSHISRMFLTATEFYFYNTETDAMMLEMRSTNYARQWARSKELSA